MNTQFWIIQAFNGISYGALLFLVGSGLSLIFGVMRIVNLSHGAYFLWGGYIALSVIQFTGSWALSIPVAAFAVALIGIAMERLFLRSEGFEYLRNSAIALGIGILVALAFVAAWPQFVGTGWGKFLAIAAVAAIALALMIGVALWLAMEKTRMGAAVRATVDDAQMARGAAPMRVFSIASQS